MGTSRAMMTKSLHGVGFGIANVESSLLPREPPMRSEAGKERQSCSGSMAPGPPRSQGRLNTLSFADPSEGAMPTPTILRSSCFIAGLAALATVASSVTPRAARAEGARLEAESQDGESDADLTELLIALDSAEAAERREAVRRLGAAGATAVLTRQAERLLRDESEEVRLEAATVLGDVGGEDVLAALHECATSDGSEQVRWGAWTALARVASRGGTTVALPMLVDTLRHHQRSAVRIEAARTIASLGDEAALAPLAAAAATDPVRTVRVEARVAHDLLRRELDLTDEHPVGVVHAGPQLDAERPPSREEEAPTRRPGTALLISGGVLAGVGLGAAITGFALLPGADAMRFAIGLGLGIPGVLVAAAGVALLVVGLLRRFTPAEEQSLRPRPTLAASRPFGSMNPRGLSYAGLW